MMINGPFTKFDCCVKKSNDQTWEDFNLCMGILGEELMFPLRKYVFALLFAPDIKSRINQ